MKYTIVCLMALAFIFAFTPVTLACFNVSKTGTGSSAIHISGSNSPSFAATDTVSHDTSPKKVRSHFDWQSIAALVCALAAPQVFAIAGLIPYLVLVLAAIFLAGRSLNRRRKFRIIAIIALVIAGLELLLWIDPKLLTALF